MHGSGGLDIRLPIGALFSVLGLMLAGYGLATAGDPDRYARSLSLNINLMWGLVMLLFGMVLLSASRRGRGAAAARPAGESAEGRATEDREQRSGMEH